jgi:regulation of enolase protein 1 (concanavalin A-like superfamily)
VGRRRSLDDVASLIPWRSGEWSHPPQRVDEQPDGALRVEAAAGSDAWLETYYGFSRDNAHALLVAAKRGSAYEVSLRLDFSRRYDQAGLLLARDGRRWIKAGIEITDDLPHAGAVVTTPDGSDWSVAPVPQWRGTTVTVRASLDRGAVILRARSEAEPWQFLRLAPLPAGGPLRVGPYLAAPEGPGLVVEFLEFGEFPADPGLHLDTAKAVV